MLFKNTVENALKQIEKIMKPSVADETPTFIYSGQLYPCHVGTQSVNSILDPDGGGFADTHQTILIVRKSVFTDGILPQENEPLTFKGVVYYIETINTDPSDAFLNITLKRTK